MKPELQKVSAGNPPGKRVGRLRASGFDGNALTRQPLSNNQREAFEGRQADFHFRAALL